MALEINNLTTTLIKSNDSLKKTEGTGKSAQASSADKVTDLKTQASDLNMSVDSFVRSKDSEGDAAESGGSSSNGRRDMLLDVSKAEKYGVVKLSQEQRTELVSKLKEQQESIQTQFLQKMTTGTMGEQFRQWSAANADLTQDGDGIWKFIASGNYTVDAETKAAAQEAISEGGYYSVEKTSQRIFDFVAAMAGDNVELMQKLQAAVQDGYDQATKAWGGELPEISSKTLEATYKLFDDYYKERGVEA
ncbi:hypothetical protein [Oribacterium sp. WCC10]|uniref:hypothetical protein n=1 Tax=Oribacterium sp. WCC10 TaxID=1855343 RepID=UPI0008E60F82|nr:hypothetical protein [Oribacterium sp. WCC10]SFG25801.1 hypothetical protein SAMN05216356_104115 [Oribacterium sp. WCC10]